MAEDVNRLTAVDGIMMKTSTPKTYTLLARYYDQFFTFHLEWYRQARRLLLGKILP
jgi:hypothetical protein